MDPHSQVGRGPASSALAPQSDADLQSLDLTHSPRMGDAGALLVRAAVARPVAQTLEAVSSEEIPRDRLRRVAEVFRKLDPADAAELLTAAGRGALRQEASGLRLLFSFLEVKRPGVEVLRQLRVLSSLERVALRLVAGNWQEPEALEQVDSIFPIQEVLQEAGRVGALDLGLEALPRDDVAVRATLEHIRIWFHRREKRLAAGERLEPDSLNFIAQLAMLEINLMEKRVSRLAGLIDPYDVRAMGRLMPILSRYDQDIEHMKNVVTRLTTYEPFFDRLMTMEHALSPSEMDRVQRALGRHPVGHPVGSILRAMRANPILDREFTFLVSLVHQIAVLREQAVKGSARPDVLSIMLEVLEKGRGGTGIRISIEPEIADSIWPTVQSWGVLRRSPESLEVRYREDRALDFILVDGTPRLPALPEERKLPDLTLKELCRLQLSNEPFILGVLENPKATSVPGLVAMLVTISKSLRILDRIMRDRTLYTGPANKDVPRLLLMSPARIPVNSLKRFIHVRFVSKMDLERMARQGADIRAEVRREIVRYLEQMKK